jgi:hypothetical protein
MSVVSKAYELHQALCDHFGERMPHPIDDIAMELLTALDEHSALNQATVVMNPKPPVNCVGEAMPKAGDDPYHTHGCLDPDSWPTQEDDGRPMHDILDRG